MVAQAQGTCPQGSYVRAGEYVFVFLLSKHVSAMKVWQDHGHTFPFNPVMLHNLSEFAIAGEVVQSHLFFQPKLCVLGAGNHNLSPHGDLGPVF